MPVTLHSPGAYRARGRLVDGGRAASSRARQAGMTLVEILIVLAVSSLMIGMVLYSANTGQAAEAARATNQLANTIRFGFNKARVTGHYYRLNINISDRRFSLQEADDRMYMPAVDRNGEPIKLTESEIADRKARDERAEESYNRSVVAKVMDAQGEAEADTEGGDYDPYAAAPKSVPRRKPPVFGAFEDENSLSELKKPFKMPKGIEIVSVRTEHDAEPLTKGEANLYFFPQGRTQKTHIQLRRKGATASDEDSNFTIIVHPLTGRVEIKDGLIDLKMPRDARDDEDDTGRRVNKRVF